MLKGNMIKGWLTSILGVLFIAAALFLWFIGVIDLVWDGVAAIILGVILLYAPRTIEKKLSEVIKAWGGKDGDNEWHGGRNSRPRYSPPPTPETNEPSIKDEPK